jgi:hypothetical protein
VSVGQPPGAGSSGGAGRPVRRSNGLPARSWLSLTDLDPRITAAVLDALASAGVPAYVEASSSAPGLGVVGVGRAPSGPVDRLWVDPDRAADARTVVAEQVAELDRRLRSEHDAEAAAAGRGEAPPTGADPPVERSSADEDAVWASIVAGWDREAEPRDGGLHEDGENRPETGPTTGTELRSPGAPAWRGQPGWAGSPPQDDEPENARVVRPAAPAPGPRDSSPPDADEHFVPPPPPPLPRLAPGRALAVLAILLGVVLLFAPGLLGQGESDRVAITGSLCILGGVAVLIWKMRQSAGPDDGAVV